MNTKIYVATHKPIEKFGDDCYQLIHVGAAQHPKSQILGAISDNDAVDNISDKNDKYCELTGLYHIWKNIKDADITGLVHYRRFFVKEDKLTKNPDEIILSQNEIEKSAQFL